MDKLKILVVDDEPEIREVLQMMLSSEGYEITEACNAQEAVEKASGKDLVILDIMMPGESGIAACTKIREKNNVPILFLTAKSGEHDKVLGFSAGGDDYLVKPFDMERIQHTLERIQRSYESQYQGVSKNDMDAVNNINDSNGNNNGGSVKDNIGDTDSINICQNQNPSEVPSGSKKADIPSEKAREKLHEKDKILIKGKESVRFFDKDDIIFVERENNATILYTADAEPFTTSMAISELEEKLSDTGFLRSHKSYLINVSKIKSIEPYGRWTYVVKFKGTQKDALITKEHFEEIKQIYG